MEDGILAHSRYVQVQPLSAATRENFSNLVQFQYTVPKGKKLVLSESYLSVNITSSLNGGNLGNSITNDTALNFFRPVTGVCLASNPVACLFQKVVHKINDRKISDIDMVPTTDTMLNLISSTKPMNSTLYSSNPVHVREKSTTTVGGTVNGGSFVIGGAYTPAEIQTALAQIISMIRDGNTVTSSNQLQTRLQRICSNLRNQPVNDSRNNRYNWSPSFGTFAIQDHIPGNTKHNLDFYIDSNWFRQLYYGIRSLNGASESGDADGAAYLTTRDSAAAANTINSSITNISLYLSLHDSYESIPPSIKFETVETFITPKTLQSQNDTINLTIPAGTYKVCISFIDSRYGSSTQRSPTNFSLTNVGSGSTNTGSVEPAFLENFQELSIMYAGGVYPQTPYNFSNGLIYNPAANVTITRPSPGTGDDSDSMRAYQDFLVNSDAMADNAGSLMDYATWCANPMFVFRIYTPPGDLSRDLSVKIRTGNVQVNNVHCVVLCMYKKETVINYDKDGMVTGVESADIA